MGEIIKSEGEFKQFDLEEPLPEQNRVGGFIETPNSLVAGNLNIKSGGVNVANIEAGKGDNAGGVNSANSSTDIVFWAGSRHEDRAAAPFRVTAGGIIISDGLIATDAEIEGSLTMTEGLISGSLEVGSIGNIRSGQTAYNTGTGFWLGNDNGTPKFSIGSSTSIVYETIAFDAVSNGGEDSNVSSSTHSHTCTGSNLVLLITVSAYDNTLADRTVSSVTYNSVAATKIQSNDNGDQRRTEIWALFNPSTGANNIVVTMGGTCSKLTVGAISLTGAGTIITSGGVSQSGSTTSASTSLTSLVDGSWLIGVLHTSSIGASYVEGSSQTNRFTQAGATSDVQVSTKTITTAGASTISWTWTGLAWRALSALIIQPASTISSSGNRLTWDGTDLIANNIRIVQPMTAAEDIAQGDAVCAVSANTHAVDLEASSDQYLSVADTAPLSLTGNFTIEFWLKPETIPTNPDVNYIISKWNTNQQSYRIGVDSSGNIQVDISSTGANSTGHSSGTGLSAGTYYHIAVVYTASTGKIEVFKNAVSVDSTSSLYTSIFDSTASFYIGNYQSGSSTTRYDGLIDDVRIWSTTKTATQLAATMNVELIGTESNLVAYWKLNNALTDSTSNAATLTNNNAATFTTTSAFTPRTEGNNIRKASATTGALANLFVGFANSSITSGDTGDVIIAGIVSSGIGTLTRSQYYLSDTAGDISTSAGTVTRKVGLAISTTELLITNLW